MRILELRAENIKRLKAIAITPDQNVVQISGPNGSGKTSVLDAIYWALAGKSAFDPEPVRRGEESARIQLDLGDILVTRTISADGKTTLIVESTNGARFPSPQSMLDKMLGALTFDPLDFMAMKPAEQEAQLRKLVKLPVDLVMIDAGNRTDYENRAVLHREIKALEGQVAGLGTLPPIPAEVDVAEALFQMEQGSKANTEIERERMKRRETVAKIADARERIKDKRDRAERMLAEADELRSEIEQAEAGFHALDPVPDMVDIAHLRATVQEAQANADYRGHVLRTHDTHQRLSLQLAKRQIEAATLTTNIAARNESRTAALAAAIFPLPGLGFGDGIVTYNGLPLQQASDAEQLRVSVGIAMATNPTLRVLRIRDGSLLDSKGLALLADMVKEGDFQCWVERVDETGMVGIVMEDGAVVAVNPSDFIDGDFTGELPPELAKDL